MKERNHYKEHTHWLAWWYFTHAVRTHGKISNELVEAQIVELALERGTGR